MPSSSRAESATDTNTDGVQSGAEPGNYFANSVSSYNWLYNFLWFNNGYHQEHHWDPKAHWTQMPAVREAILPQMMRIYMSDSSVPAFACLALNRPPRWDT